jgi:hypothetical protein
MQDDLWALPHAASDTDIDMEKEPTPGPETHADPVGTGMFGYSAYDQTHLRLILQGVAIDVDELDESENSTRPPEHGKDLILYKRSHSNSEQIWEPKIH